MEGRGEEGRVVDWRRTGKERDADYVHDEGTDVSVTFHGVGSGGIVVFAVFGCLIL